MLAKDTLLGRMGKGAEARTPGRDRRRRRNAGLGGTLRQPYLGSEKKIALSRQGGICEPSWIKACRRSKGGEVLIPGEFLDRIKNHVGKNQAHG